MYDTNGNTGVQFFFNETDHTIIIGFYFQLPTSLVSISIIFYFQFPTSLVSILDLFLFPTSLVSILGQFPFSTLLISIVGSSLVSYFFPSFPSFQLPWFPISSFLFQLFPLFLYYEHYLKAHCNCQRGVQYIFSELFSNFKIPL